MSITRQYINLSVDSLNINEEYTFPVNDGNPSDVISTDGSGNLTWIPISSLLNATTDDVTEATNLYFTNERVDDRVAVLIQNGTGISWVYNDAAGTLTPTVSLTPFSTTNLLEGGNLYYTNERVDDRVAVLIQNGTGISWAYNDAAGTLTPTVSLTPFTTDNLTDVGATNKYVTLQSVYDNDKLIIKAGSGISIVAQDGLKTLTISSNLSAQTTTNLAEGTNLYFTNERVDDRVATLIQDSATVTWTYNDIAGTLIANAIASLVDIQLEGTSASSRSAINFIAGDGIIINIADNGVDSRADITISSSITSVTDGTVNSIRNSNVQIGDSDIEIINFTDKFTVVETIDRYVTVDISMNLEEEANVQVNSAVANLDIIVYNISLGIWENTNILELISLNQLSDVVLTSPIDDGDSLIYVQSNGTWVNGRQHITLQETYNNLSTLEINGNGPLVISDRLSFGSPANNILEVYNITNDLTFELTGDGTIRSAEWNGQVIQIEYGGTGSSTRQGAIDSLTDSSNSTIGHVLTVDGSGSAVFQALGTGSLLTIIKIDGTTVSTLTPTLDFNGSDFTIVEGPSDTFDISINVGNINHNSLFGVDPDEHIDHTQVTITAGEGLSYSVNGEDISRDATIDLDITSLVTEVTLATDDLILFYSIIDGEHKTISYADFLGSELQHNLLAGLDGGVPGSPGEYYHLSNSAYSYLFDQDQSVKTSSNVQFRSIDVNDTLGTAQYIGTSFLTNSASLNMHPGGVAISSSSGGSMSAGTLDIDATSVSVIATTTGATSGINITATSIVMSHDNTSDVVSITLNSSEMSILDEINEKGLVYAADYDTNGILDDNWIPSYRAVKAYADGLGLQNVLDVGESAVSADGFSFMDTGLEQSFFQMWKGTAANKYGYILIDDDQIDMQLNDLNIKNAGLVMNPGGNIDLFTSDTTNQSNLFIGPDYFELRRSTGNFSSKFVLDNTPKAVNTQFHLNTPTGTALNTTYYVPLSVNGNLADVDGDISLATVLDDYQLVSEKNQANGYAGLDADGFILTSQLRPIAITSIIVVSEITLAAFMTNNASYTFEEGDVILLTTAGGIKEHYLYNGGTKTVSGSYSKLTNTQVDWSQVVNTPTTLAGYGITDALNLDQSTSQTIVNGTPLLDRTLAQITDPKHLVNKEYADSLIGFRLSYFFNNTVDGLGGIYRQMTNNDLGEVASTLTTLTLTTGNNQPVFNFINDVALGVTKINAGIYQTHVHASFSGTKTAGLKVLLYIRDGVNETLIGQSTLPQLITSSEAEYDIDVSILTEISLLVTDKLVVKFLVDIGASGSNGAVTLHLENDYDSRISVPIESSVLSDVFVRKDEYYPSQNTVFRGVATEVTTVEVLKDMFRTLTGSSLVITSDYITNFKIVGNDIAFQLVQPVIFSNNNFRAGLLGANATHVYDFGGMIREFGYQAFNSNTNIIEVYLPEITGSTAFIFKDNTALTKLVIPKVSSVQVEQCTALTYLDIRFATTITSLVGCPITTLIADNLETVGGYVFNFGGSFTDWHLPKLRTMYHMLLPATVTKFHAPLVEHILGGMNTAAGITEMWFPNLRKLTNGLNNIPFTNTVDLFYAPNCKQFGSTQTSFDDLWAIIDPHSLVGTTIVINDFLRTSNAGGINANLADAITRGATVKWVSDSFVASDTYITVEDKDDINVGNIETLFRLGQGLTWDDIDKRIGLDANVLNPDLQRVLDNGDYAFIHDAGYLNELTIALLGATNKFEFRSREIDVNDARLRITNNTFLQYNEDLVTGNKSTISNGPSGFRLWQYNSFGGVDSTFTMSSPEASNVNFIIPHPTGTVANDTFYFGLSVNGQFADVNGDIAYAIAVTDENDISLGDFTTTISLDAGLTWDDIDKRIGLDANVLNPDLQVVLDNGYYATKTVTGKTNEIKLDLDLGKFEFISSVPNVKSYIFRLRDNDFAVQNYNMINGDYSLIQNFTYGFRLSRGNSGGPTSSFTMSAPVIENIEFIIPHPAALDENDIFYFGLSVNGQFADANGNISLATVLDDYQLLSEKNAVNGYAGLDANGLIPTSILPPIAITSIIVAAETTLAAFRTNNASYTYQEGDVILITTAGGIKEHYLYNGGTKTVSGSYSQLTNTQVDWSQVVNAPSFLLNTTDTFTGNLTFPNSSSLVFGSNQATLKYTGAALTLDLISTNYLIRDDVTTRFTFNRTTGDFTATGNVTGAAFIMTGGTSSQVLLANGTVATKASLKPSLSKTGYIEAPVLNDYIPLFRTSVAITLTSVQAMLRAAGDIDVRLYWDTSFTNSGTNPIGIATTITAVTETAVSIATDATIPANSWIFGLITEATTSRDVVFNFNYTED